MREGLGLVCLFALLLCGCVLLGYDADVGDDPQSPGAAGSSSVAAGSSAGTGGNAPVGGSSGTGGTNSNAGTGGGGGTSAAGAGRGGVGASGFGGGSSGTFAWFPFSGTGGNAGQTPDAGEVVDSCVGASLGTPCEDGLFCTVGDSCLGQTCVGGLRSPCSSRSCVAITCNEDEDRCDETPKDVGAQCGFAGWFQCQSNGECGQPITCEDDVCDEPIECDGSACPVACNGVQECDTVCTEEAACGVACEAATECSVDCSNSLCAIDCYDTESCEVDCEDSSECYVVCQNGYECSNIRCLSDSICRIDCTDDDNCAFSECWDAEQSCGDGSVVCGGPC